MLLDVWGSYTHSISADYIRGLSLEEKRRVVILDCDVGGVGDLFVMGLGRHCMCCRPVLGLF